MNGMRAQPGPHMTLANMRQNGVRAVIASCANCGRSADVNVDLLPETMTVPETGQRLRCSHCGGKTISTRPAWHTGTRRPGTPDYLRERPPTS
jgi:DNA-directed RNA polymerase subunit RPC12/RpoP